MMYELRRRLSIVGWAIAVLTMPAGAATSIAPVIIDAPTDGRAVVTVINHRDRPVLYQLTALSWQVIDGHDRYEPTQDYIASPPLFTLAARQTQVIRIGIRDPVPMPLERAYRLAVAEVPHMGDAGAEPGTVNFAIQYLLPVYVAAADRDAKPILVWTIKAFGDSILLRAENVGQKHVALTAVSLSSRRAGTIESSYAVNELVTILAKSWREWRFAAPGEKPSPTWRILVRYQGSADTMEVPDADIIVRDSR